MVERQTVALVVAGSTPVLRPTLWPLDVAARGPLARAFAFTCVLVGRAAPPFWATEAVYDVYAAYYRQGPVAQPFRQNTTGGERAASHDAAAFDAQSPGPLLRDAGALCWWVGLTPAPWPWRGPCVARFPWCYRIVETTQVYRLTRSQCLRCIGLRPAPPPDRHARCRP